jgi:hypothetical protein
MGWGALELSAKGRFLYMIVHCYNKKVISRNQRLGIIRLSLFKKKELEGVKGKKEKDKR